MIQTVSGYQFNSPALFDQIVLPDHDVRVR